MLEKSAIEISVSASASSVGAVILVSQGLPTANSFCFCFFGPSAEKQ